MGKRTRVARELRYHHPSEHPWSGWESPDDDDEGDGGARVREPRTPLPHAPEGAATRDLPREG
jgi:hypothetical protein